MKKAKNSTKIILGVIIVFSFIFSLTSNTFASSQLNWDNPNQGKNTYKFKASDLLSSDLAMQVVGCTGVVNKVSDWMTNLVSFDKLSEAKQLKRLEELATKTCRVQEKSATTAAASIKDFTFTDVIPIVIDCQEVNKAIDDGTFETLVESKKEQTKKDNLEQCFNGIAITLARNQLTAMTRSGVNWINSGFGGNPLYVQSMTNLTNSIERNILESTINQTFNSPYGDSFSRTAINTYRSGGLKYGATNFMESMGSDLAYFLTDKDSYFSGGDNGGGNSYYNNGYGYENTGYYGQETTRQAAERARIATDRFANDFSVGGWDGWLALTQRDQNNPLGYTMLATDYLSRRIDEQANETKQEVYSNGGFLNQKRCLSWYFYDENEDRVILVNQKPTLKEGEGEPDCAEWETVTPGSIIKEKLTTYVNSPERQLELADTINESLNSLFSALVSKLQNSGLPGLSSGQYEYLDDSFNWVDDTNVGFSTFSSGAFRSNVDLTRDLGNTYYYNNRESLGTWDAKNNIVKYDNNVIDGVTKKLTPGLGPIDPKVEPKTYTPHRYFTVTVPGNQRIIENGYNGWALNDRAYWDGENWQNWKAGQPNPIKKRGIIQIQKDYVVAAKEILKVLPSVMPKLGELDYCIPGPNPSYKSNSSDIQSAYIEWVGSLDSTYEKGNLFRRDSETYSISRPGKPIYEAWKTLYDDVKSVWHRISDEGVCDFAGDNTGIGHVCWPKYLGQGTIPGNNESEKRTRWVNDWVNYVNIDMFKGFYKEFDPMMKRVYYDKMTRPYLESENSSELIDNPAYIPMAEEGLSLTKNIIQYDEDITEAIDAYNKDISQANVNVGKLEAIRKEVGIIINEAQGTRNDVLLEAINKDRDSNGLPALTMEQFLKEYSDCLDEEDILYYDDNYIMSESGDDESQRCFDKLDNDLDGLADKRDPDCKNANTGNGGSTYTPYGCSINQAIPIVNTTSLEETATCVSRQTESECLSEDYIHLKKIRECKWTPVE